jgi:UDP-glucose 4-epimerase
MEKLYIIGGSGFIGKNLIDYLHEKYSITVFDKFIDEEYFSKRNDVLTVKQDLVLDEIPESYEEPNYIINLASIVTAERDLSLFDGLISSNLKIMMNLYNRFKDSNRLNLMIQFGSSEEYGNIKNSFDETMREEPNSPYALVKQLTVNTAMMLYRNYGFPIMAVRPGNLFGKYQNRKKFLPYVISQLKENKELNVTPCEQKRDFIYAKDFAYCIDELLEHYIKSKGQIVNVSSGYSTSLKHIIEHLKSEIKSQSLIHYGALPYRENEIMDLKCSITKLETIIGKSVDFDINKRLKDLIIEI